MRTTLNIDDEALAAALEADPGKTKTAVINDALRDYARLGRRLGHVPAGHGHAELLEDRLALVLVDLHAIRAPPSCARGSSA